MKAELNLHVTYSGKDAGNSAIIKSVLQNMLEYAADRGHLTGDWNLVVEESTFEVTVTEETSE